MRFLVRNAILFAVARCSAAGVSEASVVATSRRRQRRFCSTTLSKTNSIMGLKRLSSDAVEQYERDGYLVVKDVLSHEDLGELRDAVEVFIAKASELTESDATYKLEEGHTRDNPRLGRVVCPSVHHETFWRLQRHPNILDIVEDLLGDAFRYMAQDKLNMKPAKHGSKIPWHQDWAFYPHTNDNLLAVCTLLDDSSASNGCLQVVPGSHRDLLYDHSTDGKFQSRITDPRFEPKTVVDLVAPAGSITIHHARLAHGSMDNFSGASRRATCNIYCAADAWPLLGVAGTDFSNIGPVDWDAFCATMVRGKPTRFPRMKEVPVSLPLPFTDGGGVFRAPSTPLITE